MDFSPSVSISEDTGSQERINSLLYSLLRMVFPGGSVGKNLPANARKARDTGLILGSGRCPREGNGIPLQCGCLGHPMARGAWWATVQRATRVRHDLMTKQRQQQGRSASQKELCQQQHRYVSDMEKEKNQKMPCRWPCQWRRDHKLRDAHYLQKLKKTRKPILT